MRTLMTTALGIALTVGLANGGGEKKAHDEHVAVKPGDLKWGPGSPALPPGAQVAVLAGDPAKPGAMFVIRVKVPDGYKVPPHTHPHAENVTVLQGTLIIGRSKTIDGKHETILPVGSFMHMPKDMPHYAIMKGETILQVHGVSPFDITYVNPTDDPRKK